MKDSYRTFVEMKEFPTGPFKDYEFAGFYYTNGNREAMFIGDRPEDYDSYIVPPEINKRVFNCVRQEDETGTEKWFWVLGREG